MLSHIFEKQPLYWRVKKIIGWGNLFSDQN